MAQPSTAVQPFLAMDVLARANAMEARGEPVIHMEIGQPSAPAPPCVLDAAAAAMANGRVPYTEAAGIAPLRTAIAGHYKDRHGVDLDPARIFVTTGSSAGFMLAFLALLGPGARIGMSVPYYPAYPNIIRALSMEPVFIRTRPETGYTLTPEDLERALADGLDALLIASPANPTGTVMDAAVLRACLERAEAAGLPVISDEIYHGIDYRGAEGVPSVAAFSDQAIVVNSFSKYYCMAGWRIGWMVLPGHLVRTVEQLGQNLCISAPTVSQYAACAAFAPKATAHYDRVVEGYAASRRLLLDRLPGLGFADLSPAHGAFYVYADLSALGLASDVFCRRLLEETGVAVTPGADFDREAGGDTVRFSFAGAPEAIAEAVDRLERWCAA